MPAGFSHILLVKNFNERAKHGHDDLETLLLGNLDFFQVGAIGPDLPYSQIPNFANKEQEIADDFGSGLGRSSISMNIKVKKGTECGYLNFDQFTPQDEAEILFKSGTKLKVIKAEIKKGRKTIYAEVA